MIRWSATRKPWSQDVAAGLCHAERARSVYGVIIAQGASQTKGHGVRQMSAERGVLPAFDFGPGRSAWEATYGVAAECIATWLPTLPEGVRRYAQAEVYQYLRQSEPGPYDDVATQQAIARVAASLTGAMAGSHHERQRLLVGGSLLDGQ